MKKHLLLISALSFVALLSKAQITKGSTFLGGQLSFNSAKTDHINPDSIVQKGMSFTIDPSFGFMVKDNTELGIYLDFAHGENHYPQNTKPNKFYSNTYGGGLYLRRYLPLGKGFYFFGQGNLGYSFNKQYSNAVPSGPVNKQTTVGLSFYPGISYAVSKRFYLQASISNLISIDYYSVKTENPTNSGTAINRTQNFSFNTNISPLTPFTIGFRLAFPGNKKSKRE